MGCCKYCQQNVNGFFKNKHPECEEKYINGLNELNNLPIKYNTLNLPIDNILNEAEIIWKSNFIKDGRSILIDSFKTYIEIIFSQDEIISSENEHFLMSINKLLPEIDFSNYRMKIVKESMIRELLNGIIPDRVSLKGSIPFKLMSDEKVVFILKTIFFQKNTEIINNNDIKTYKRMNKGIYLEKSDFIIVIIPNLRLLMGGDLWVTNKNLYFYDGNDKGRKCRFSYNDIDSIIPCSNSFIIFQNNSLNQTAFITNENGWFACNLITNLIEMKNNIFNDE